MSNAPAHAAEHDALMQLVVKATKHSKLIDGIIIITVGTDGRPIVGGNYGEPGQLTEVLRQLVAAEDQIANIYHMDVPKDN